MTKSATNNFFYGLISSVFAALVIASPIALIRGAGYHLFTHWQEEAFFVISIVGAFVGGISGFRLSKGLKDLKEQRNMVWISFIFGYLYIACAALCERLELVPWRPELLRNLGLSIFVAGALMRLWAIITLGRFHSGFVALQEDHVLVTHGPYKFLRHPSYLGAIIALIGIPLIFGTYLPLLAVPGFFVLIKWRIQDEENFLEEHLGNQYLDYKKKTWRLLPFLY